MDDIITDTACRYILIQETLLNNRINLVNVYGPNDDNPKFFENVFLLIGLYQEGSLMAGDFNCTFDPHLDHSSSHSQSRKELKHFMTSM